MKTAIVGSRGIKSINLEDYLPDSVDEIISGGAKGVDTLAKEYAEKHNIKYTEYLPEYSRYGRYAPLKRNDKIIEEADIVYAFYDGKSKGTGYVISSCRKNNKKIVIFNID